MGNQVCVLTSVHTVEDERILLKECKSLAGAGYLVTIVAPHSQDDQISGIRVKALAKPRNRVDRLVRTSLEVYAEAMSQRAGVYHFHDPELIPVGLLLRLARKKVIYDIHEQYHLEILGKSWISPGLRKFVSLAADWIERFAAKRFSALVTAGDDIEARFASINADTILVRNLPLIQEFPPATDASRFSAGQMACFGGISIERATPQIVEAFGMLPRDSQARLILGGNSESKNLEQMLASQPGWRRVEYQGFLRRREMISILATSTASIVLYDNQPNHLNVRSNRFFDSLAAGLPVITPNFPRWKDIVEIHGCGLTVDPSKPSEISDAVTYLTTHPKEAAEMGQRGYDLARQSLNWDSEATKLIDLYARLFAGFPRNRTNNSHPGGDGSTGQQEARTSLLGEAIPSLSGTRDS
jgi:glycosyltransferase involved in cell wall biosynthesis